MLSAPRSCRRARTEILERRLCLAGVELVNDVDTLLLLHFNGNTTGAGGETPVLTSGGSSTAGLIGQARSFSGPTGGVGDRLNYATASNLSATSGTIGFAFKPAVAGNAGTARTLFEAGDNFAPRPRALRLSVHRR